MASGLQIFDASGTIFFDSGKRVTRIISTTSLTIPANSAYNFTVNVAGMVNDGTWGVYSTLGTPAITINTGNFTLIGFNPVVQAAVDTFIIFRY